MVPKDPFQYHLSSRSPSPCLQTMSRSPLLSTLQGPPISSPSPQPCLPPVDTPRSTQGEEHRAPGVDCCGATPGRGERRCRLGNRVVVERSFIPRLTVSRSPLPNTPQAPQGDSLNSQGRGSPASRSWRLRQSAPRNSRTPVWHRYSCPGWQSSLPAHSCSA